MPKTEYDNVDIIGETYKHYKNPAERRILQYYHRQEFETVSDLLIKMQLKDFSTVIDLGCSIGAWYDDYKRLSFKKIIGIDISAERAGKAKARGYDEVHICNAYNLPFDDESENCVVSNNVILHVLQDSDRLKIFKEVERVLKKNGIFIFSFANASGFGYKTDVTLEYERYNEPETIKKLISQANLHPEYLVPCYYMVPRIGAHPWVARFSSFVAFPTLDLFLRKLNNIRFAKIIYVGVKKIA